ncbi:MAG: FAD:protein FMN transferase [Gammaproteobacteria bacterium]
MTRPLVHPARLILVLAALVATACAPDPGETRVRFMAMGTLVDITVFGAEPETAEAAAASAESLFHRLQAEWDPWGEGALGQLNQDLSSRGRAMAGPDLYALLEAAAELSAETRGRFDPTVGSLVRLWGFSRDEAARQSPPEADEVAEAAATVRPLADLLAGPGELRAPPGTRLDLGGFAKGVAVQRATDLLLAEGLENVLVNAGGDLRAVGRHGDRPWRVGVRQPRGNGVLAVIETAGDESVFTSGDYERFFLYEGTRYHHILDPRSGWPARGLASVTVVHGDAGVADAAATALFVAGEEDWPATAAAMGISLAMVVTDSGVVEMTPGMKARLRFPPEVSPETRIRKLP